MTHVARAPRPCSHSTGEAPVPHSRRTTPMNLRLALALLVLLSPACFAAEPSEAVKAAVEKMPPRDSAQESELAAELLKLGAPALREMCALVIPLGSGDDTKARMA